MHNRVIPAEAGTHPRPSNPPSFPRRREPIPRPSNPPSFPRRREPIPRPSNPPSFPRKETFAQPSFPRRACPRAVGGGNSSPARCTAIASEAVRHAARANQVVDLGGGFGLDNSPSTTCDSTYVRYHSTTHQYRTERASLPGRHRPTGDRQRAHHRPLLPRRRRWQAPKTSTPATGSMPLSSCT